MGKDEVEWVKKAYELIMYYNNYNTNRYQQLWSIYFSKNLVSRMKKDSRVVKY